MRTSVKIISALSVAGLAVAAGSAFTASNTLPAGGVSGYGQSVSTGANITTIANTPLSTDNSKLDSVTFTSTTDLTGKTVSMTLKNSSTVIGNYACTFTPYGTGPTTTITCSTGVAINGTLNPLLNAFDTTGLTVL